MFRKALSSLILCAAAIGTALAQAEDASLRKELTPIYAQIDKCIAKQDIKGVFALIHTSFVQYDADGNKRTYTQSRQDMESMKDQMKGATSAIKIDNVYRDGDEIVAWITMKVSIPQGGNSAPMVMSMKFVETLKRFNGKLMFVESRLLP